MARYVVPVTVLLALVGGYVVGQQPTNTPTDLPGDANRDGKVDLADMGILKTVHSATSSTSEVGRYVPFEGGRMLDSTNGTLYRIEGDAWVEVVKLAQKADSSASLRHRVFDKLVEDGCDAATKGWTSKSGTKYTFAVHGGCPSADSIELIKRLTEQPAGDGLLELIMIDSDDFTPAAEAALDAVFKHKGKAGTRARLYSNSFVPGPPGSN